MYFTLFLIFLVTVGHNLRLRRQAKQGQTIVAISFMEYAKARKGIVFKYPLFLCCSLHPSITVLCTLHRFIHLLCALRSALESSFTHPPPLSLLYVIFFMSLFDVYVMYLRTS